MGSIEDLLGVADAQRRLLDIALLGNRSLDDDALLAGLTVQKRVSTMRRLLAVVLWDVLEEARPQVLSRVTGPDGVGIDANDLLGIAGVGRAVLSDLRKRWREDPRLEVMIPYAAGRARGTKSYPEAEAAVREELAARPEATTERVAVAVTTMLEGRKGAPTLATMRRIVAQEREGLRMAAPRLHADFGTAYVIDYVPMELAMTGSDAAEWAGLGVVLEAASGLILGWSVQPQREAVVAIELALETAAAEITRLGLRASGTVPSFDISMPPDVDFLSWARLRARFADLDSVSIRDTGVRRLGRGALPLLGQRLGQYRLRPRKRSGASLPPTADEVVLHSVHTRDEAAAAVGRGIRKHNEPILKRLRQLALIGRGPDEAAPIGAALSGLSGRR